MKKKFLTVLLCCALLLSGCSSQNTTTAEDSSSQTQTLQVGLAASDLFTARDLETGYDAETAARITLEGDTASCDSDAVTIDGSTITITDEGTYVISGTLENGMLMVDAEDTDKVQIVLNNASITNETSAALYVREADKVFLTTAPDSENSLSSGDSYVAIDDNNIDAAVFSKSDLTLNGSGTLTISSPAGHGVVSKDDLAVTSGTYTITAASQGLSGKDSVRIADGTFTIQSGKDGIHGENTDDSSLGFVYIANGSFSIQSEGDGISSSILQVDNGSFSLQTGGGSANAPEHTSTESFGGGRPTGTPPADRETGTQPTAPPENQPDDLSSEAGTDVPTSVSSASVNSPSNTDDAAADPAASDTTDTSSDETSTKGLKASAQLMITGGTFSLDTADDALHSNGDISISGGTYTIATGDDGIHADNAVTITDCDLTIADSYEGIEGLSIDISGGTISVKASDDGLNAAGGADSSGFGGRGGDAFAVTEGACITISGGTLTVDADGDGLDSNGDLRITGGVTYVAGPTSGADSALDCNGEAEISGGIFAATGTVGMASTFGDSSTQASMLIALSPDSTPCTITVLDADGTELFSWDSTKNFSSVLFSSPELEQGAAYTVTAGANSAEVTLDTISYRADGIGGGMGGGRGGSRNPGERPDQGTAPDPSASQSSEAQTSGT